MLNKQEQILATLKQDYDTITIPENIDEFLKKGMVKSQIKNRVPQYMKFASIAAAITLFVLAATIRISPVFADYLQDVPVLKYIVWLVNQDKGLKAAIENDFIQNIDTSDEHENIKFTVDSVIVDQARMVIFYTVENNNEYMSINMYDLKLKGKNNLPILASYGYGFSREQAESRKIQNSINVSFTEDTIIPDIVHLEVNFSKGTIKTSDQKEEPLPYLWKVDIPIDKSKFENLKEIYNINQTVEIEDQKININKATVYPTKIAVDVSFPENNTMKIFNFETVRILNEKGEILPLITNDVMTSHLNENHKILYFESNYFAKLQNLYLEISCIRALPKEKADILVDLDKKELLKAPDEKLILQNVTRTTNEITIDFLLKGAKFIQVQPQYHITASSVADKNGKSIKVLSSSNMQGNGANQQISITLENTSYESTIKLMFSDYPNTIKGDCKVKLK